MGPFERFVSSWLVPASLPAGMKFVCTYSHLPTILHPYGNVYEPSSVCMVQRARPAPVLALLVKVLKGVIAVVAGPHCDLQDPAALAASSSQNR